MSFFNFIGHFFSSLFGKSSGIAQKVLHDVSSFVTLAEPIRRFSAHFGLYSKYHLPIDNCRSVPVPRCVSSSFRLDPRHPIYAAGRRCTSTLICWSFSLLTLSSS